MARHAAVLFARLDQRDAGRADSRRLDRLAGPFRAGCGHRDHPHHRGHCLLRHRQHDARRFSIIRTTAAQDRHAQEGQCRHLPGLQANDAGRDGHFAGIVRLRPHGNLRQCHGGFADDPIEAKIATNGTPLPGTEIKDRRPGDIRPISQGEIGLSCCAAMSLQAISRTRRRRNVVPARTASSIPGISVTSTKPVADLPFAPQGSDQERRHQRLAARGRALLASHPRRPRRLCRRVADQVRGELVVAFVDAAGRSARAR